MRILAVGAAQACGTGWLSEQPSPNVIHNYTLPFHESKPNPQH